jgi:hypothetical protein
MTLRAKFSQKVYVDCFSEKDLKLINQMPEGWLPERDDFRVQLGGTVDELHFNGMFNYHHSELRLLGGLLKEIKRRFPSQKCGGVIAVFDVASEYVDEHRFLQGASEDLEEEIKRAKATARTTLNKFTTVEKLVELWPQIEPFTRGYVNATIAGAAGLPAIRVEELNKTFGLPVEEVI